MGLAAVPRARMNPREHEVPAANKTALALALEASLIVCNDPPISASMVVFGTPVVELFVETIRVCPVRPTWKCG